MELAATFLDRWARVRDLRPEPPDYPFANTQWFPMPPELIGNERERLLTGCFAWLAHCMKVDITTHIKDVWFFQNWDTFVFEEYMGRTAHGYPAYYFRTSTEPFSTLELVGLNGQGDLLVFSDYECGRLQLNGIVQTLYRPWQRYEPLAWEVAQAKRETPERPIPADYVLKSPQK